MSSRSPVAFPPLVLALTLFAVACGDSRSSSSNASEQVRAGAAFVRQRGCPSCHEPSDGAGTLAGDFAPVKGTLAFPANLTPDPKTGLGGWADADIVRAFRYGIDNQNMELCLVMPRLPTIGDTEAYAIVAYLRSLPPVTRAIPDSYCPPLKPLWQPDMAMPTDL
jgi:hypothetical protein